MSYEELTASPLETLAACVDFLGWPREPEAYCQRVVDYCRFDNMRKLEEERAFDGGRALAAGGRRPEGFKVRKGRVGGYHSYLSDADVAYMDRYIAERLDPIYRYS